MSKSLYKVPYLGREVLLKCIKKSDNLVFHDKNTLVPFYFVNKDLQIRQGKTFKKYKFRKNQLGLKLGEFVKTRNEAKHKGKRVKISKKRPKIGDSKFIYDFKTKFFTK